MCHSPATAVVVVVEPMNRLTALCLLKGASLSPSALRAELHLKLVDANEPGEVGRTGRYKGHPMPFGAAGISFGPSSTGTLEDAVALLEQHIEALRAMGAEEIQLYLSMEYDGQCNMEFDPEMLGRMARLKVPVLLSAYEDMEHVRS